MTPNSYTVNELEAVYRFYVSSFGEIPAKTLFVTNTLPIGHKLDTFTVSSSTAPTDVVSMITGTLPSGQEVITFTITSLPVGGRLSFDVQTRIDSACNLPADINVALFETCGGVNGACEGRDDGVVHLLPGPYFLVSSNDQTANLPLCEPGEIELVVKNSSATAPEFDFTITDLVDNAVYITNTAYVTVTNEAGQVVTGTTSGVLLQGILFKPTDLDCFKPANVGLGYY